MVTKRQFQVKWSYFRSVLAKILMVTKPVVQWTIRSPCSVLAKILMVTKLDESDNFVLIGSVLAKILMVTKPQKYGSTFLNVIEY